jgi:hypothetical protein
VLLLLVLAVETGGNLICRGFSIGAALLVVELFKDEVVGNLIWRGALVGCGFESVEEGNLVCSGGSDLGAALEVLTLAFEESEEGGNLICNGRSLDTFDAFALEVDPRVDDGNLICNGAGACGLWLVSVVVFEERVEVGMRICSAEVGICILGASNDVVACIR